MGEKRNTAGLQLSGIIGMASLPDMQKIRIIGFFFQNILHWLWNFVADIAGGKEAEGVWERSVEENIWT